MLSFEYDLRYLQAGGEILDDFLYSQDVYWPLGVPAPPGEPPYPQFTLGGLALAQARAGAKAQNPAQQEQLRLARERVNVVYQSRRAAWGKKTAQEVRSRLVQWRNFLEEYREKPGANYDRYGYEVFRRVVIELLLPQSDDLSGAEQEMIQGLDGMLKALLVGNDFVWDAELSTVFPKAQFWFLYSRLPKEGVDRA